MRVKLYGNYYFYNQSKYICSNHYGLSLQESSKGVIGDALTYLKQIILV